MAILGFLNKFVCSQCSIRLGLGMKWLLYNFSFRLPGYYSSITIVLCNV